MGTSKYVIRAAGRKSTLTIILTTSFQLNFLAKQFSINIRIGGTISRHAAILMSLIQARYFRVSSFIILIIKSIQNKEKGNKL